jgi:hypothetical protein
MNGNTGHRKLPYATWQENPITSSGTISIHYPLACAIPGILQVNTVGPDNALLRGYGLAGSFWGQCCAWVRSKPLLLLAKDDNKKACHHV